MAQEEVILDVRHLRKYYPAGQGRVLKAVDDVSFQIRQGETLGIVGESGCGKTTCGKTCIGMLPKTGGQVFYRDRDVHAMNRAERLAFTRKVQMIFQNPYAALDPHYTAYRAVAEGIRAHRLAPDKDAEREMVYELLEMVGLKREQAICNVSEFSGGQRQRISIARALAVDPEFLFCDEPVSALDVSLQAQIVNLLLQMQRQRNLTMLFIAHDLAVVRHISDHVGVMYLGKLVELADSEELYAHPAHPYTQALLSALPVADPETMEARERVLLSGDVPSAIDPPAGCRFCGRCRHAAEVCRREEPALREIRPGHTAACHLYDGQA
ncbi:MAG: ABC transporter ATP-binding protein [Oscillospiraceae bacterium]